jgi:hypothetical protein
LGGVSDFALADELRGEFRRATVFAAGAAQDKGVAAIFDDRVGGALAVGAGDLGDCERYSDTLRKRNALPITETEDRLMASAAMSGLNNQPVNGYNTPAAKGIPNAL